MASYEQDAGIPWRLRTLEERVKKIEELKPEVLAYEVGELVKDVKALKRIGISLILTLVTVSISFSLTVLSATGKI